MNDFHKSHLIFLIQCHQNQLYFSYYFILKIGYDHLNNNYFLNGAQRSRVADVTFKLESAVAPFDFKSHVSEPINY